MFEGTKLSLLSVIFFSMLLGLTWIFLVPIWHFPDEQAHFGQVTYLAEKGKNPTGGKENDLTQEIYVSEELLGTARDKFGNNKFTHHPNFKIDYSDSYYGFYEASISALANTAAKTTFIHKESTRYPILYYLPAAVIYKLFYQSDIFVRVYLVRFWSLALYAINIFVIYKLAELIFSKNKLAAITLTMLVGFQPMMVFANAGVTSDSMGNLLFSLFLYFSCFIIIRGVKVSTYSGVLLTSILSVYAKPQFIIQIPLIIFLTVFILLRDMKGRNKSTILVSILLLLVIVSTLIWQFNVGAVPVVKYLVRKFNTGSFLKYSLEYTLSHTYSEVLPWYWGVYKWLGVTYPRVVHRIINYLLLFSGVGFLKLIYKVVKGKKYQKKTYQAGIFLLFTALLFYLAISFYDWLLWSTTGYPLGVQGRYFFPLISVCMLIFMLGVRELLSFKNSWMVSGTKSLGGLMVLLNFYGLYTVANTYYDTTSLKVFIIQASQYKPEFIKGIYLGIWLILYLIVIIYFLIQYIKFEEKAR